MTVGASTALDLSPLVIASFAITYDGVTRYLVPVRIARILPEIFDVFRNI